MKLVVASKNYSSWSLRPWILCKVRGIALSEEVALLLDHYDGQPGSSFPQKVRQFGGAKTAGKVPLLIEDSGLVVWDSLAICERLNELRPDLQLWPADAKARATARSVVAEMHSGFSDLRSNFLFNATSVFKPSLAQRIIAEKPAVGKDVARINEIWVQLLDQYGGPYLFGKTFTIADAFYAPVVGRFITYQIDVASSKVRDYIKLIHGLPAYKEWRDAAQVEVKQGHVIRKFELYQDSKL